MVREQWSSGTVKVARMGDKAQDKGVSKKGTLPLSRFWSKGGPSLLQTRDNGGRRLTQADAMTLCHVPGQRAKGGGRREEHLSGEEAPHVGNGDECRW